MQLRTRQIKAIEDLRDAYRAGYRAPVLVMPTGGGKTHTSSVIMRDAVAKGRRVWFLAHLREILDATSAKLTAEGIAHGFIMAGKPENQDAAVQVVMVQTAVRRLGRFTKPDLIVIDEAHLAVAETYRKVVEDCGSPRLLLLTATPIRLDGRGMREVADLIVPTCDTAELIAEGLLAPVRYYAPSRPDLKGVRTIASDYAQGDLAKAMNKPSITGDAVAHYTKLAHGKPAVAFCTNIAHANETAETFRQAGYKAVAISGDSKPEERDAALRGLNAGHIDVVCNCALWVAGVDAPAIGCIIMLAPTKSLTKYLQSIGRGLRTHPGKTDCIVLDHAGNAFVHGLPTEPREWSLDGAKRRSSQADDVEPVRQCERCYFVHSPAPVCPNCGHVHPVKERKIQQTEGELAELTEIKRQQRQEVGRAKTIEDLRKIAEERGYKMGWVYQQLRIKSARGIHL
jgi:superfamily II DNA or RNA helicase